MEDRETEKRKKTLPDTHWFINWLKNYQRFLQDEYVNENSKA